MVESPGSVDMRDVQRASEMRALSLELVRCAINRPDADLPRSVVNLMLWLETVAGTGARRGKLLQSPFQPRRRQIVLDERPHNLDHGLMRGKSQHVTADRLEHRRPKTDDIGDLLVLDAPYQS
jgi:hypothetical protein